MKNLFAPIAGTTYRREWSEEHDLQIAVVEHPSGPRVWCVGCVLAPTWEKIITANELLGHIEEHRIALEKGEPE